MARGDPLQKNIIQDFNLAVIMLNISYIWDEKVEKDYRPLS